MAQTNLSYIQSSGNPWTRKSGPGGPLQMDPTNLSYIQSFGNPLTPNPPQKLSKKK